jgi:ADP-ribose pyrophosphatase YjhB (NUDIX family)
MPELGAMVVVQHGQTVLLTQREDFAVWCLPGGAVDPREAPDVAAVREVREETGLEVHLTRLVAVIARPQAGLDGRMTLVFAGTPVGGALAPDPCEVIDLGFFAHDALPAPLMAEHAQMVAEAMRGASGQVWLSSRRIPPEFPDRAALYRWRDQSGLSRQEAYAALQRMVGEVTFTCVVGGATSDA